MYKGSNKIKFDFGSDVGRLVFSEQIRKIDDEQREKERLLKELIVKKEHWIKLKEHLDKNGLNYLEKVHKNLKEGIKLYDYQIGGVLFINEARNVLLSHEMGLGKTIQSIAYVEMNDFSKVFVITPNSLKFNFYNEVNKFTNSKAHIVNWKKNQYSIEEAKYIIVNYEYFNPSDTRKMNTKFKKLGIDVIDCLICDESHKVKNTKSNTFKNFKRIFNEKIFRNGNVSKVFLSGTPMPNRVQELYTVLNQISPIEFPTKRHFYEYYCGMGYDPAAFGGWTTQPNMAKLEELYNNISPYTHRKRKADVLKDLPDKIYQKIILELNPKEQALYDEIEAGVANEFIAEESENMLTIMLRLRQYTSSLKTAAIVEFIDRLLEEGQKVVIVDYFKDSLGELKEHYKDIACLHTGDYAVEDRAEMVREFQDSMGKIQIFLGSIQTCNYGLTLTAANRIFVLSLPYSVGEFDQVIDRCVLKGELVLTKEGYTPIENVNIGDLVYTHKGNWKSVINTKNKIEKKKEFYDIKYHGFHKPLRCTGDHKIYVYNINTNCYEWTEAKDLNIFKHYMVFSKLNVNNYTKKFNVLEHKINNKTPNRLIKINKNISLTDELLYVFGRFVGDGWVSDNDVSICGLIKEYETVKKCINVLKREFNIDNYGERLEPNHNRCSCYVYSKELTVNFENWFGKRAENKKIPDFIFHLERGKIKSFLDGYYGADGYKRKNTQQASTVSRFLSYQLVLLENMLGNSSTLKYNEMAKCWSFEYSLQDKIKRKTLMINDNGNGLYPIQEIFKYKPKRQDERVYDLEVEDDSSFVVGLSSVHNCHRIGQKDVVNAYSLIYLNTIDEYVFNSIEAKRAQINKVMDNEDYVSNVSESVMGEVMKMIGNKYGKTN